MPIDVSRALNAEPHVREITWTPRDVLLYHLSVGAEQSPDPLRWAFESDLQVLPTFAMVAGSGISAGEDVVVGVGGLGLEGVDVDLRAILHAGQSVRVHRPIPARGRATLERRVAAIWDKGRAAVIEVETSATLSSGEPLWTAVSQIWARGEGGFSGEPGPSTEQGVPEREPDRTLQVSTGPSQAMLYRLNGDMNPLHVDPRFAEAAGLPAPILHGLATYGLVARALVDEMLSGDATRLQELSVRFAGVLFPGDPVQVQVWTDESDRWQLHVSAPTRDDAPVLSRASARVRPAGVPGE